MMITNNIFSDIIIHKLLKSKASSMKIMSMIMLAHKVIIIA